MASSRRTGAQVRGHQAGVTASIVLGRSLRASRLRRHLTQSALAERVGLSRARIGQLETGQGLGASVGTWFTLAESLGLTLRMKFGRDPTALPADAGHLAMQELVLRLGRAAGLRRVLRATSRCLKSRGWSGRTCTPPGSSPVATLADHFRLPRAPCPSPSWTAEQESTRGCPPPGRWDHRRPCSGVVST
ncbi:MAG: helix-turn-helix transcriptional regulator [Chloroflexi bacterium]|nr:helix-turn-helix transcriptional regulator [Chloroflexota bacterium]